MLDLARMMVEEERYKDRVRQFEHDRLARSVVSSSRKQSSLHCQLLAGLGRSLTSWGMRLQARYGAMTEVPAQYYQPGMASR